jgi:hypothetical protein
VTYLGEVLFAIEQSALGVGVRSLGGWGYAFINLAHILGIATLSGSVLVLDLRLMGLHREVPLQSIASNTLPLMVIGFITALVSGLCLLSANASEYAGNPFLLIKFSALAVALINILLIGKIPAWKKRSDVDVAIADKNILALAGSISLLSWLVVIGCGRLIAYW